MNILITGASTRIAQLLAPALAADILDVSDLDAVIEAAEGMDAIINLSVLRPHRQVAFDVNARGTYNACAAAVHHGIRRLINSGPHFTITGPTYENSDHMIGPDVPSQSGTLKHC